MIDAGFNPLNQICEATGESMSDLVQAHLGRQSQLEELQYAVQAATSEGGQFYNGMLEASQTFSGRMFTLKDNVAALTGELTSGLFAALGDLVVKLNDVVTSFLDSDEKMAQLKDDHRHCYVGGRGGGRSVPGLQGVCGACHGCRGRAHRCHHGHDRSQRCR